MRPCWAHQSALLFEPPLSFASTALIRTLLAAESELVLIYAGDRMWPTVRHGERVLLKPRRSEGLAPGGLVVAETGGIPELLRIGAVDGRSFVLGGDSDLGPFRRVGEDSILGCVDGPLHRPGSTSRLARRVFLDVAEALRHGPDERIDAARSVKLKYDRQAVYYTLGLDQDLPAGLHRRLERLLPARGRILVAGSGVGTECFALAREGWSVCGVDFAPEMISRARREASRRGADVEFQLADLRDLSREPGSIDALLFTWDVYSFIPLQAARRALLHRMRSWLRPGGVILLSARMTSGLYERLILTLAWLASSRAARSEWGASHSRWIDGEGRMRRSFLRKFTLRRLRKEISGAGLVLEEIEGGHCILRDAEQPGARG